MGKLSSITLIGRVVFSSTTDQRAPVGHVSVSRLWIQTASTKTRGRSGRMDGHEFIIWDLAGETVMRNTGIVLWVFFLVELLSYTYVLLLCIGI